MEGSDMDKHGAIRPSKLVVLSSGMWGAIWNLEFMRERLQQAGGSSAYVHSAVCNTMLKSYSGIDVCGTRLAAEVRSVLDDREDLGDIRSVSFIGYSAGGLFVRYAIGVLHDEGFFSSTGITLDKVITMATPHLGVRSSRRQLIGRVRNGLLGTLGNMYGGASLDQMTLTDQDGDDGTALVLHMSRPGTRYIEALKTCQGVYLYANAWSDNTVSYCSAALARRNSYRGMKDVPQTEGFPVIAGVYRVSDDGDLRDGSENGSRSPNGHSTDSPRTTPSAPKGAAVDAAGHPIEHAAAAPAAQSTGADETAGRPPDATTADDGEHAADKTMNGNTNSPRGREEGDGTAESATMGGVFKVAGATLLAPIVLVHFILLMLPLRVAYAATVDNSLDSGGSSECFTCMPAKRSSPSRTRSKHVGVADRAGGPPEGAGALPDVVSAASTDSAGGGEGEEEENQTSKSSTVPVLAGDCNGPVGDAQIASTTTTVPSDVGRGDSDCDSVAGSSSEFLEGGPDGLPAAIRRDLARPELDIRRVDVCLPGAHTHGTIVVRRPRVSQAGKVVVDHVATLLFA